MKIILDFFIVSYINKLVNKKTTPKTKASRPVSKSKAPVKKKAASKAKATVKKAATKTKVATSKPKAKTKAKKAVSVPVPVVEIPAPAPAVESKNPTHQKATVELTKEGAHNFRAMVISKESFPLYLLKNAQSVDANEIKTREQKLNAIRAIGLDGFVKHEGISVPSFVKSHGEKYEDIAMRAISALGFKPSKARFVKSVTFTN